MPDLLPAHAFEGGEIYQAFFQQNILIQTALFRQVANLVFLGFAHRTAEDGHGTRIRLVNIQDNADAGGLTRAVGPKQAKNFAGNHLKGNIFDRLGIPETFADMFDTN